MKLRVTRHAARRLVEIAEYIREHDPDAAVRVGNTIREAFRTLTLFPAAGRRQTRDAVRKFVTPKYPYLIYYTVRDDVPEVVILDIRHPAQERTDTDG